MSVWSTYENRIEAIGGNVRNASGIRETRLINHKVPNSLSYHGAVVDGVERQVAIINSDNLTQKTILSMPGEDIRHGSYVEWMDNHWLVTERDANTTLYTKAKLEQCNYLLKWVSEDDVIIERWCIIEDGTKYLTGEMEDRNFVITRGDSRIAVTLPMDEETARLGRENRFLIDDLRSPVVLAYQLTKPFKLGWSFNGNGVYKFVMQEVTTTNDDNQELGIADYYKHFPHPSDESIVIPEPIINSENIDPITGKRVWL